MCALCGTLGGQDHWTEPEPRAGVYLRYVDPASRRRERARRISAANRILRFYGLALEDWQADSYILRSQTGKSEMFADLAALWPTAERLAGRALDPLDPATMDKREHG